MGVLDLVKFKYWNLYQPVGLGMAEADLGRWRSFVESVRRGYRPVES